MRPRIRTWTLLPLAAIVLVVGMFMARKAVQQGPLDPLTEAQQWIERSMGMKLAKEAGPEGKGLPVEEVRPDSLAARVGIEPGDRVVAVGDRSVWHIYQFQQTIEETVSASPVLLMLVARGDDFRQIAVPTGASPGGAQAGHSH